MSETLTNGVIVPDKGSRDWYADLRSNWLKLDSLMAGGNITVNPAQTEGVLVATITVGGKEYKLYQQDGDVSVKIDPSAENAEYPLVASTSAEANTGSVVMAPAVTVNPSTGAVTATSFKGKLDGNASTATTATKAVQDGAGAVIADTYATKTELNSKANDNSVVHRSGNETIAGNKTFSDRVLFSSGYAIYIDAANNLLITRSGEGHGNNFKLSILGNDGKIFAPNGFLGNLAGNADTATKATQDAAGNIITTTYAKDAMVLKNLTGNKITPGAVIDCGTGNGMLVGWFMNTAGAWVLATNKPTGKWKSSNNYSLLAEESGMFVKVG